MRAGELEEPGPLTEDLNERRGPLSVVSGLWSESLDALSQEMRFSI